MRLRTILYLATIVTVLSLALASFWVTARVPIYQESLVPSNWEFGSYFGYFLILVAQVFTLSGCCLLLVATLTLPRPVGGKKTEESPRVIYRAVSEELKRTGLAEVLRLDRLAALRFLTGQDIGLIHCKAGSCWVILDFEKRQIEWLHLSVPVHLRTSYDQLGGTCTGISSVQMEWIEREFKEKGKVRGLVLHYSGQAHERIDTKNRRTKAPVEQV